MAGEIVSYGYPRQANNSGAIDSATGAKFWPRIGGARFCVGGANDFKVSKMPGLDRGVRIEAGVIIGDAIMDEMLSYDTIQLPAPAGDYQWFMLVMSRNWAVPSSSHIAIVPGGTNTALPTWKNIPGTEVEQPFALCRVKKNETVVDQIIDLRCWSNNGGMAAADATALQYLGRPAATVTVGTRVWRYRLLDNGVWGWKSTEQDDAGYAAPGIWGNGFTPYTGNGYAGVKYRVLNGVVFLDGAAFNKDLAWKTSTPMFALPSNLIPQRKIDAVNCVVDISGNVLPGRAGKPGEAISFAASWPLPMAEV